MATRFGVRRRFIKTTNTALDENNFFAMAGLDLYNPDELMKDSKSPFARNFRVFKDDDINSRVAVSKRDGHRFYSVPVGETDSNSVTSTTGAADQTITYTTWIAQRFTPSGSGRLTKVSLNLKNTNSGTAPLIVKIYSETASAPGTLLATSSVSNSSFTASYAYIDVRFIEAPVVVSGTNYYIVVHQQVEATGDYKWSSTTSATTALTSSSSGNTWSATSYALNYHAYVSTDAPLKAFVRFYRTTAAPETLIVAGTNLYRVNDTTGDLTSITSSLSSSATDYKFATVDNKLYFVNGVDAPWKYDGSTVSAMGGSPQVSIDITAHKNRIFLLATSNRVIFSDVDNVEVFQSVSFLYVPAALTADLVQVMIPFQDNLVFFTRNTKWVLYGSDLASFVLRESTAKKGCTGAYSIAKDTSFIYFTANDFQVYAYNGGTDVPIGKEISRQLKTIADQSKNQLTVSKNKLWIHYVPSGQSSGRDCLVYDLLYREWLQDTEVWSSSAKSFNSQTDYDVFVRGSSLVGAVYYGETGSSDLGKPILFDYYTKYFSFGHPSRKHRLKRLYPFFRPGDANYSVTVAIDVDNQNSPFNTQTIPLGVSGATWGGGYTYKGGSLWGGGTLSPTRLVIPGQNRKHQIRYSQHGVDNSLKIIGFSTYTSLRRPI